MKTKFDELKEVKFDELSNIESLTCILGLRFPDSANEFQKALLTLAHLCAALRDSVLSGHIINVNLIEKLLDLAYLVDKNREAQK